MKACAARDNMVKRLPVGNLILPVPDTDFRDFLDKVDELARFAPGIVEAIEKDLDACEPSGIEIGAFQFG